MTVKWATSCKDGWLDGGLHEMNVHLIPLRCTGSGLGEKNENWVPDHCIVFA